MLWQISRGQIVGLANPMFARDFRQYYSGMVFQSSVSRRMAPCECLKKLATASTMVVLVAATRAPTGPTGEKPPQPFWFISGVCVCGSKFSL
jgi:hypothetical protein